MTAAAPASHVDSLAPFKSDADSLAAAIRRLAEEDAVSLPLVSTATREAMLNQAQVLDYRPAKSVIGEGDRRVWQDCEVSCAVPWQGPIADCARQLDQALTAALARVDPPALTEAFSINDLMLQRYRAGSAGITPHRDHIDYRGLISVITLSGDCRFAVCPDRSGTAARSVPAPPGWLLLMRGPGLFGRKDRPFHFVDGFAQARVSLGLRHDRRLEPRPDPAP